MSFYWETNLIKHLQRYGLVYLATPYTHYEKGIYYAFVDAAYIGGKMLMHGVSVFSPIAAAHPMAVYSGLDPFDTKLWLNLYEKIMEVCEALVVADMPGWEESEGVTFERKWFAKRKRPAYLLNVNKMTVALLEEPEDMDNVQGTIHVEETRKK